MWHVLNGHKCVRLEKEFKAERVLTNFKHTFLAVHMVTLDRLCVFIYVAKYAKSLLFGAWVTDCSHHHHHQKTITVVNFKVGEIPVSEVDNFACSQHLISYWPWPVHWSSGAGSASSTTSVNILWCFQA